MQLFSDENKHTIHLSGLQIVISVKCTFISALRGANGTSDIVAYFTGQRVCLWPGLPQSRRTITAVIRADPRGGQVLNQPQLFIDLALVAIKLLCQDFLHGHRPPSQI